MVEDNTWEILKHDSDYEISTQYDDKYKYPIRKISSGKYMHEFINSGYYRLRIGSKYVKKHRMIALQWIENDSPDTNTVVDHKDRNKLNNHISNLRWVTQQQNRQNQKQPVYQPFEYLKKLPPDSELIREYNDYEFDQYYYDIWNERIIMITNNGKIKVIKPYDDCGFLRINMRDINGKRPKFGYNKTIEHLRHDY